VVKIVVATRNRGKLVEIRKLRELAGNSRAVTVVTHATKSLGLCQKLVVMGRGGVLCFQGSPDEALEIFGDALAHLPRSNGGVAD